MEPIVISSQSAAYGINLDEPIAVRSDQPAAVARREWAWAFGVALALAVVSLLPYALGYALERPGLAAIGLLMNPEDSQSYFAKMLQGYDGRWLYTIPFTPEPHGGAFVGGFYLALGHLARLLGLSLEGVWHAARVTAGMVMALAIFGFVAVFTTTRRGRWAAYLLALFGSGLGWLLFLLNQPYWIGFFPIDFKMAEAHPFFTALTFPHVAVGVAFIVTAVLLTFKTLGALPEKRPWLAAVAAGVVNLLLAVTYPFLIYLTSLVGLLSWSYLSLHRRRILLAEGLRVAVAFVIPAPLVLYYAWTLRENPVFAAWGAQSVTLSPPWPHYVVAYGPMLFLGALAVVKDRRRPAAGRRQLYLWLWIGAAALLLYAPVNAQRRFVQGLQIPLAIVATAGLLDVLLPWLMRTRPARWLLARPRYAAPRLERLLIVLFLAFMSLSNVYVLLSTSLTAAVQQPDPLFRTDAEMAATAWLRQETVRTAVVLGAYQTGNLVAARAGNPVVIGHWTETMDYEVKSEEIEKFYQLKTTDSWRQQLLAKYDVAHVWHGPREVAIGSFDPAQAPYLEPLYVAGGITIYQVQKEIGD